MKKYDLIVIGGGGGTKVSTPAAKLGKKVAIIEENKLGGTCLNRGCIPSKMLIHPANVSVIAKDAAKLGVVFKKPKVDFSGLVTRVSETIDKDSAGIAPGYERIPTLDFYHAHATFVADKIIEVGGEKITAPTIVIATGSTPAAPPIEGLDKVPYMTSTEALRNTKMPKKLIVLGGGYIACELGHAYGALGAKTHFLVRSGLLGREDDEVKEEFTAEFTKHHQVTFGTKILSVSYGGFPKKFTVTFEVEGKKQTTKGDALLVATGVKPNTNKLGLENTGIKVSERGYIETNEYMETAVPGVYAIGDIAGKYLFRHSVNFEGEYLFGQLFSGDKKAKIVYPPMPHAVFTNPEIAAVGPSEADLQKQGIEYVVGKNKYIASAMGQARMSEYGFVKLLFDAKSQKLLATHIIGEDAATMIHQFIYAMTFGATRDDLLKMIYIHPALPEVARNAVRNAKFE